MTVNSDRIVKNLTYAGVPVSFAKKHSFFMTQPYYRTMLKYIGFGYGFGCIKYWPYSWQSDPENSFALPDVNFDAAFRHLILLRTGFTEDADTGYCHLPALLTRIAMAVGVWYHAALYDTYKNPRVNNYDRVFSAMDKMNEGNELIIEKVDICNSLTVSPYHLISYAKFFDSDQNYVKSLMLPFEDWKHHTDNYQHEEVVSYLCDLLTVIHNQGILPMWGRETPGHIFGDPATAEKPMAICRTVTWLDYFFGISLLLVHYIDYHKLTAYGYIPTEDIEERLKRYSESLA